MTVDFYARAIRKAVDVKSSIRSIKRDLSDIQYLIDNDEVYARISAIKQMLEEIVKNVDDLVSIINEKRFKEYSW